MNKLVLALCFLMSSSLMAAGSGTGKEKNPMNALTLEDGCVLVFADGIDKDDCIEADSPAQSGQQYICQALVVCSRDK